TDFEMNCRSASSTTLGPSESHTFAVIPSTVYPTSAIVADSSAQGSWVITCTIWLQPAPVDDSIVESEIGEQWSPKTEPARIAAIAGSRRSVRSRSEERRGGKATRSRRATDQPTNASNTPISTRTGVN